MTQYSGMWTASQQMQAKAQDKWPSPPVVEKTVQIKVWGAGGGAGNFIGSNEYGGPGGYAEATFTINGGTVLSIFVGQAGGNITLGGDPNGGNGVPHTSSPYGGGKGGGFTGVFTGTQTWAALEAATIPTSNALIIAGSGGGGSYYSDAYGGGYGGGTSGAAGMNRRASAGSNTDNGGGGGATAGGAAGSGELGSGVAGSLYKGGNSTGTTTDAPAGGGGAGWYGGGSGGLRSSGAGQAGGGGGGSGMIASVTSGTSLPTGVSAITGDSFQTQTGTGVTAPNAGDSDYVSGVGEGGTSNSPGYGGDGFIVIYIDSVKTTYTYTGDVVNVTV